MRLPAFALALLALAALACPATAQEATAPGEDIFSQGLVAPDLNPAIAEPATTLNTPQGYTPPAPGGGAAPAPATAGAASGVRHALRLEARLVTGGPPVSEGLIWRVFSTQPSADGALPLVDESQGGTVSVQLPAGAYLIHAAFGRAGATKRVSIADADLTESLVLDAGGMELDSVLSDGRPIRPELLSFEVQQQDEAGEPVTVVPNASAGRVLRLSAGTYHVISRYGHVNAVVRADIEVVAGKLTEAVMRHTGAEVTLKLVSAEGGEALANTSWTVTTQDGTEVHESVGAFPSIILAAGSYTAVARHQDQIYSRDFTVETGVERDIEVRLTDVVTPETGTAVANPDGTTGPETDSDSGPDTSQIIDDQDTTNNGNEPDSSPASGPESLD